MTYEEALEFLNAPRYSDIRPGLGPMRELMAVLGNPQDRLKYVHVAGTNGKGSTSAMIENVLRRAGYRTGFYSSPYLENFTERIRVSGEEIGRQELADLTLKIREAIDVIVERGHVAPTIFEMITAVAYLYFAEKDCDIVVLEVGMGGRLDATNIISEAEVSVITAIDRDHMNFLGDSIGEIAYEKAGIIKEQGRVVSYMQRPEAAKVIEDVATDMGAELTIADVESTELLDFDIEGQTFSFNSGNLDSTVEKNRRLRISLAGSYQRKNAVLAYKALEILKERNYTIDEDSIRDGFSTVLWAGRFEKVYDDPLIVIDAAHNPEGVEVLVDSLEQNFPDEKFVFIVGVLADKEYEGMFDKVLPLAKRFVTVTPESVRALPGEELAEFLRTRGAEAEFIGDIETAVGYCIENFSDEKICSFGSLYYIGEVRTYCRGL